LREGKPLKPKTLLFNIRVQQNQQHNHQITSLIVEFNSRIFILKKLFNKMEGVSACREKGFVETTTTI